jgi:hypothetical protein
MPTDFSSLEETLTGLTSVVDASVELITSFAAEVRANSGNQAKVNEIAGKYEAQAVRLGEAVAANTETEPTEPTEPPTPV